MPHGAIPFPFGKCRICQDKATGVHYGVATCEGCKGFFKRSIPKADKYKCFFGSSCDITPKNRNRCKACRFKLCLQYGMSVDAVKMGRIPKTEKEQALAQVAVSDDKVTEQMEDVQSQPSQQSIPYLPDCSSNSANCSFNTEVYAVNSFLDKDSKNYQSAKTEHTQNIKGGNQDDSWSQERLDIVSSYSNSPSLPFISDTCPEDNSLGLKKSDNITSLALNDSNTDVLSSNSSSASSCSTNSHFSSVVIEELVRQVFETSRLKCKQPASQEILSLADSRSDFSQDSFEALEQNNTPLFQESSMPSFNNQDFTRQNVQMESSSNLQNLDFSQLCDDMLENSVIPNSQNKIDGDKPSIGVKQLERTEEDTLESNALIEITLKRFKEPVEVLFAMQEYNRECYRQHLSGEHPIPFTTTDKQELKEVWAQLMEGVQRYNTQVLGFCMKVPGFSNFLKSDQEKLIINAYMEILMMIHAEFMNPSESYVLLNNKPIFYSKATMTVFLGEELTMLMLNFGKKFSEFKLTDFEIGLLCAIRLTNPEVADLAEREKVELLSSHFLDIFASVLNWRPNSSRIAMSLFQSLTVLKTIATLQQEAIFNFNVDNPPESATKREEKIPVGGAKFV